MQGEARRRSCSTRSGRRADAVLLATASFWQGVDVAGEQPLVRDRRQAAVRVAGGPVVSARIDRLRRRGADAFGEYQVPRSRC